MSCLRICSSSVGGYNEGRRGCRLGNLCARRGRRFYDAGKRKRETGPWGGQTVSVVLYLHMYDSLTSCLDDRI